MNPLAIALAGLAAVAALSMARTSGSLAERVQITFPPKGLDPIFGVRKTVMGVPVVEVHSGYYFSSDLRASAYRDPDLKSWVVEIKSGIGKPDVMDPLSNKRDALLLLARLSGQKP